MRRRGWLRLKGRDHCLELSCCRMPFIYRLLHPACKPDGAQDPRETNARDTSPRHHDIPNGPEWGTFRQTYEFILPGWALALRAISPHYPWHDNSYNMPGGSHSPCLADGATFKWRMSKSFIIAHHQQLGFGTSKNTQWERNYANSNVRYSVKYWRQMQSDTGLRNQGDRF